LNLNVRIQLCSIPLYAAGIRTAWANILNDGSAFRADKKIAGMTGISPP
jgi:hypothetical protein